MTGAVGENGTPLPSQRAAGSAVEYGVMVLCSQNVDRERSLDHSPAARAANGAGQGEARILSNLSRLSSASRRPIGSPFPHA